MEDNSYDYRGYLIRDDEYGVFIGDMECVSYDDAVSWVDAQLDGGTTLDFDLEQINHTYCISFYDKHTDRVSRVEVDSYDINEAINRVTTVYCPGSRVTDWYDVDG